jgi:hypothetical protein
MKKSTRAAMMPSMDSAACRIIKFSLMPLSCTSFSRKFSKKSPKIGRSKPFGDPLLRTL